MDITSNNAKAFHELAYGAHCLRWDGNKENLGV